MTGKSCIIILFCLLVTSCLTSNKNRINKQLFAVKPNTLIWFDSVRKRPIPVAFYLPQTDKKIRKQKVVIFSHGYGENKGGANIEYTYLTESLASKGYSVASIQHELATDSLLPMTGIPQIVRRSNWERGVLNILFVLNQLKNIYPDFDYQHLILIGHSNGGDMSMLFAAKYPGLADKVISLDSRRVTFPRTHRPRIYSLRSADQVADEGVLPTEEEQKKYKMQIIKLSKTNHNDMDNDANSEQRNEINNYILRFLNDN